MKLVGTLATLAALGLAVLPTAAQTAPDTTAPTLRTPMKSSFLVGRAIDKSFPPEAGCPNGVNAREKLSWHGSDDAGSVRYTVVEHTVGEGDSTLLSRSKKTTVRLYGTNWNNDCGGGAWQPAGWTVKARDAAGNTSKHLVRGGLIAVTQDNRKVDNVWNQLVPNLAYSGNWTRSKSARWSRGTLSRTSDPNASVTAAVTVPAGEATHLALVMAKGPGRGAFEVSVDGVVSSTVDTYASHLRPRVVTWQVALRSGPHTVRVVNLATAGRPTIDFDAVLTN